MIKKYGIIGLLIVAIVGIIASYRWVFGAQFDPTYFKHFYDHSQWSIANSPRIMGDGELYQYAGYSLLQGNNPFVVNPEVPPAGKYMYALSLKLFNNAFAWNIPLYLLSVFLFWILLKKSVISKNNTGIAVLLYATSPLVFSQIGDTGLDLLYVTLFIGFWIALKYNAIILSGVILGLFASTKFGLFALAPLALSIATLGVRNWRKIVLQLTVSALVYVVSYAQFFREGHSFIEWLNTQKWIMQFYASSEAPRNPLATLTTMLLGQFKRENVWQVVTEWTVLWTAGIIAYFQLARKKSTSLPIGLTAYANTLIIIFLVVPFAVRYILLILPVLIIAFVVRTKELKASLVAGMIVVCLVQSFSYIVNAPERATVRINGLLSANRFDDLYAQIQIDDISRNSFSHPIHNFINTIEADQTTFLIELKKTNNHFAQQREIDWISRYYTAIGLVEYRKSGYVINHQGRWLLRWDNDFIAPHFSPVARAELLKEAQVGGKLTTKDEKVLSKGVYLPHISLLPEKITSEETLFPAIKLLTGIDSLRTRTMVHVDYPSYLFKRIGFVKPGYDPNLLSYIATQSGVMVRSENHPNAREYAMGAINNKLVDDIQAIEEELPSLKNYIQGSITLTTNGEQYIIYQSPQTIPRDITLEKSVSELFGEGADMYF